jgi:L-ascorbate metabolism protein UlaG (beta-lactamase superfamily)
MTRRNFINKLLRMSLLSIPMGAAMAGRQSANASGDASITILEESLRTRSLRQICADKQHHGRGVFLNPFNPRHERNLLRVLQWKLFSPNEFKDQYAQEKTAPIHINWKPVHSNTDLSFTFLPHAGLMIKDKGDYLLFDPIFFGLNRLIKNFTPIQQGLNDMPAPDRIVITHGHYDHLDTESLSRFDADTPVISPLGYDDIFQNLGMRRRNQLDWYEYFDDGKRRLHLIPCNHWTMRNPFYGPNRSLWGSFVIETAAGPRIYFSGDTAYFDGFKEIGRDFDIDLAIFNVGAYEPRWFMKHSHMNPEETVQAFRELGADHLMILHWGTFRLGNEPVFDPPLQMHHVLKKAGLLDRWVRIEHGQTLFLPGYEVA